MRDIVQIGIVAVVWIPVFALAVSASRRERAADHAVRVDVPESEEVERYRRMLHGWEHSR